MEVAYALSLKKNINLTGKIMEKFDIAKNIEVEFSETKPCLQKMTARVTPENISKGMDFSLIEISKMASVSGFRQGKAPAFLIKTRFSDLIRDELKRSIISAAIEKMEDSKGKFDILSYIIPDFEEKKIEDGKEFSFSIEFDVLPEIKLPDYKKMNIALEKKDVSKEDIEQEIAGMKKAFGKYGDVDDGIREDDMLELALESDGVLPDDAPEAARRLVKSGNMWVWVRQPEMIPGVNKALLGAKTGDKVEFTAEYPSDFRDKTLAGMKIKYSIVPKKIQRIIPLEDINELCGKLKIESPAKLEESVKRRIEGLKQNEYQREIREKLADKLCEEIPSFPIPEITLNDFKTREINAYIREHVKNEGEVKTFQEKKDERLKNIGGIAEKNLRRYLILRKIAELESIEVGKNDIDEEIKNISAHYGVKEAEVRKNIQGRTFDHIQMALLDNKVIDFLVRANTVSDKKTEENKEV
jgi:trigger factor